MTALCQLPEHLQDVQAAIRTGFVNRAAGRIDGVPPILPGCSTAIISHHPETRLTPQPPLRWDHTRMSRECRFRVPQQEEPESGLQW